jgi:hypothetical protein
MQPALIDAELSREEPLLIFEGQYCRFHFSPNYQVNSIEQHVKDFVEDVGQLSIL